MLQPEEGFLNETEGGLSMKALEEVHAAQHLGRTTNDIMDVSKFHELGHKGKGIKIAILDSGLGENYQQKDLGR